MFQITWDPSSGSVRLYLIEITYDGSHVLIMCVIGVWRHMPPNTDRTHNKHMWTIICNFNQVQANTPWWWIPCDPKHAGVIFDVFFRLLYYIDFNVYDRVECISCLIKVVIIIMHGGNMKFTELLVVQVLTLILLTWRIRWANTVIPWITSDPANEFFG